MKPSLYQYGTLLFIGAGHVCFAGDDLLVAASQQRAVQQQRDDPRAPFRWDPDLSPGDVSPGANPGRSVCRGKNAHLMAKVEDLGVTLVT